MFKKTTVTESWRENGEERIMTKIAPRYRSMKGYRDGSGFLL